MINQKYFDDICRFKEQFSEGVKRAENIKPVKPFTKIIFGGMGGSSFFIELLNQIFENQGIILRIDPIRSYKLPAGADSDTLVIVSSYSGNPEETLSILEDALAKNLNILVITHGGKLLEIAEQKELPLITVPGGVQPRLATGYFISSIVKFLTDQKSIPETLLEQLLSLKLVVDQDEAKALAEEISGKVPIIYASQENSAVARIVKIKFNENSKTQSFFGEFPEQNHNELEGFSNLIIKPFIILLESKFTHPRIIKRFEIYAKLYAKEGMEVRRFPMSGNDFLSEAFNTIHFFDYVSYFLAEIYNTDPESVKLLESFKVELKKIN